MTGQGSLSGDYVWTGPEIEAATDWVFRWTPEALAEVDAALEEIERRGLALDDIGPGDFPIPSFAGELERIAETLRAGRGLVQIKGLPADRYDQATLERFYWVVGAALGVVVSQSYKGDRLGHVIDIGEPGRYYTVGGALEMHMDPVDVVGLLCLHKAVSGGESRLASSSNVFNVIAAERPDMIPVLRRGFHYSSRAADRADDAPAFTPHRVPVFDEIEGIPACFYLPLAVRNAAEKEGAPMSDDEREALALVNEVAQRPGVYMEMDLEPGDIQFLNNRLILHGRADYVDSPDPALKRHLLRLWLMMPGWPPRPVNMNMHGHVDRAAGGIAPRARRAAQAAG